MVLRIRPLNPIVLSKQTNIDDILAFPGWVHGSISCLDLHDTGRRGVSVVIMGVHHPPTWMKGCYCLLLSVLPRRVRPEMTFPSLKFSFPVFLIVFNWCQAKRQEVVVQAAFFGQFFSLQQHEMSHVSKEPSSHKRSAVGRALKSTSLRGEFSACWCVGTCRMWIWRVKDMFLCGLEGIRMRFSLCVKGETCGRWCRSCFWCRQIISSQRYVQWMCKAGLRGIHKTRL